MRTQMWENEVGWGLTLIVKPGRGASVSVYQNGRNVLYQTYEYHETQRAEAEAQTLADLGHMRLVSVGMHQERRHEVAG